MIQTQDLSMELGQFCLKGVSLSIEEGEYFVLAGPTGAGKTVFIECVAGLHKPREGEIYIAGEVVTDLQPEERYVGYVPQDYALFPHMNVYKNIAYGLHERKLPKNQIDGAVRTAADLLDILPLLDRRPLTLSGGEQQRVALARAFVTKPRVMLFDEPLSALDESTRATLIPELKRIHAETHATTIHVCHTFDEMLALGQRIAILNAGELQQVGTPDEVWRHPASEFVARFVGAENVFSGMAVRRDAGAEIAVQGLTLVSSQPAEGQVSLSIRPEDVHFTAAPSGDTVNCFQGRIRNVADRQALVRLEADVGIPLVALLSRREFAELGATVGDAVHVRVDATAVHIF